MYRVILFLLIVLPQWSFGQSGSESLPPKVFNKKAQKKQDAVILDVRTPEEFKEGHIENAINVDIYDDDDFEKKISTLDRNKTYFVYCKAGVRSSRAVEKMKSQGFKNLVNLEGGIDAWKEEGLPITSSK